MPGQSAAAAPQADALAAGTCALPPDGRWTPTQCDTFLRRKPVHTLASSPHIRAVICHQCLSPDGASSVC